jgi:hypothetical protein
VICCRCTSNPPTIVIGTSSSSRKTLTPLSCVRAEGVLITCHLSGARVLGCSGARVHATAGALTWGRNVVCEATPRRSAHHDIGRGVRVGTAKEHAEIDPRVRGVRGRVSPTHQPCAADDAGAPTPGSSSAGMGRHRGREGRPTLSGPVPRRSPPGSGVTRFRSSPGSGVTRRAPHDNDTLVGFSRPEPVFVPGDPGGPG